MILPNPLDTGLALSAPSLATSSNASRVNLVPVVNIGVGSSEASGIGLAALNAILAADAQPGSVLYQNATTKNWLLIGAFGVFAVWLLLRVN